VVLAVLLLGDPVTNGQFAGVVLIVAGVAWLSKQTVDGDATLADAPARRSRCRSQRRSCSRSNR